MTNNNTSLGKPNNEAILKGKQSMSYSELSDDFCAYIIRTGKSKQELKNFRSVIKSWRESLELAPDSLIKSEFGASFETWVKTYVDKQITLKISYKTYSSRVSHIRAIRRFYLKTLEASPLPTAFGARLKRLLEIRDYTLPKFWRHHLDGNLSYDSLYKWVVGKSMPSRQKFSVVEAIERSLNVSAGTLTSALESYPLLSGEHNSLAGQRRNCSPKTEPYRVWTDELQAQHDKLVEFKTAITLSAGVKRRKNSRWTGGTHDQPPPSAEIIKGYLRSFFGFCSLPPDAANPLRRGLGLDPKILSLSMLADVQIVEKYFAVFRFKRSNNIYTNGTLTFANFIASLLRPDTGYLFQSVDFCGESRTADLLSQWQEKCLNARKGILEFVAAVEEEKAVGGEQFGFGRDPRKFIKDILDSSRPLDITMQMTKRMLSDVDKLKTDLGRQAVLYRDILLISMLQANPLRAKMFSLMEIDRHLVKRSDGSWWLQFKKNEFKNRHSLKSDYLVQVSRSIWSLIDRYLTEFRPRLSGADDSKKLFLPLYDVGNKKHQMHQKLLAAIVANRTKQYIPNCRGFRLHAFRYIVATHIIKENPEFGFFLAAKVLHDKLSTVEEHYAHLKTSEFFEPYNRLFSRAWNLFNPLDIGVEADDSAESQRTEKTEEGYHEK